jgi:hypothetical protein
MREETEDSRSFLNIDENQLDRAWIEQPRLFERWAFKAATLRLSFDEAKADLDVLEAELGKKIRDRPEKYGLQKITENAVTSTIPLQKEHRNQVNLINTLKYKLGIVQAVVDALDHKKKALENLVQLHGQNYFSVPQAKNGSMKEVEKQSIRRRK